MKVYLAIMVLLLSIANVYLYYELATLKSKFDTLDKLHITISLAQPVGASQRGKVALND